MPILTKEIYDSIIHNIENLKILIFSYITDKNIRIDSSNITIIENDIIDLDNDDLLYEISINYNKNISIEELKKLLIKKHILSVEEVVRKNIN